MLHRGTLPLADPVDQRIQPEATPFLQDLGIVRDDEAAVVPQAGDNLKDIAGHGGGEPFSVGLGKDRLQPMFRPPRGFDGNDNREFHAAAGCRRISSAALATSRAASVSSSMVGRTAIR